VAVGRNDAIALRRVLRKSKKAPRELLAPVRTLRWRESQVMHAACAICQWYLSRTIPVPCTTASQPMSQGCDHMTCKCGEDFCYLCGKQYPCKTDHIHSKNGPAKPVLSMASIAAAVGRPQRDRVSLTVRFDTGM